MDLRVPTPRSRGDPAPSPKKPVEIEESRKKVGEVLCEMLLEAVLKEDGAAQ